MRFDRVTVSELTGTTLTGERLESRMASGSALARRGPVCARLPRRRPRERLRIERVRRVLQPTMAVNTCRTVTDMSLTARRKHGVKRFLV